ncbi:Kelch repeat-containing protein [Mucilaginibacter litoreus]|uniref:Kelch repeat-containing protein n=1 Tax=Mucilaginibacter litoreus TaxID=1048221 RepID=A0ABW3AV30_9SPHI
MPSKKLLLILVAIFAFSCKREPFKPNSTNALPGLWKQLADFPGLGRVRSFGFSIAGKGYILGGNAQSGFNSHLLNDLWEYDPVADHWTQKADYPGQAGEYIRGFVINGKAYVGTGFGQRLIIPGDDKPQNIDFWEYDPANNEWTRKANFAGEERESVISFAVNNVGYMGLGTNDDYSKNYKDFWKYDVAADKWTRVADYPGQGSFGMIGFALNGMGYAGLGGAWPDVAANDFWKYDATADKWSQMADFSGDARAFSGYFVAGAEVFAGMGSTLAGTVDDWYRYNPETNKWLKSTYLPGPARYDMINFTINGIGYIGTGNPGLLKDFWKFTPAKKD